MTQQSTFFPDAAHSPRGRAIRREVVAGTLVCLGLAPYLFSSNHAYNNGWAVLCVLVAACFFCADKAGEACRAPRSSALSV